MVANGSEFVHFDDTANSSDHDGFFDYDYTAECLNEDCVWEREREKSIKTLVPLAAILGTIGVTGTIGNIVVLTVFMRSKGKQASTYLILMLAVIDLMACSLVIPGVVVKQWFYKFNSDVLCKVWEMLRNFAIIASAMILVAIACERYFIICRGGSKLMLKKVTRFMIVTIIVLAFSLAIPPMLGVGVYVKFMGEMVNMGQCRTTELLITAAGLKIYWYFVTTLFGLMICIIVVLYSLIFVVVYKQNKHWIWHRKRNMIHPSPSGTNLFPKNKINNAVIVTSDDQSDSNIFSSTTETSSKKTTKCKRENIVCCRPREQTVGYEADTMRENNLSGTYQAPSSSKQCKTFSVDRKSQIQQVCSEINIALSDLEDRSTDEPRFLKPNLLPSDDKTKRKRTSVNHVTFKPMDTNKDVRNVASSHRNAHIKTTQVLFIVTIVYIISFLPMFLMTHNVIKTRIMIFYLYFINNAANPIVYSFLNRNFRVEVRKTCNFCR
ncbi:hypothetical protein ACJMK2_012548 [Sinanodonta woodiana]|uniref:G-protein coupled receptors family 1 profile domain-containing protein n=1 Tax=Sinanodonta woodiana TaxID=1069815 RepID=A0ABD3VBG8_SINWO